MTRSRTMLTGMKPERVARYRRVPEADSGTTRRETFSLSQIRRPPSYGVIFRKTSGPSGPRCQVSGSI